MTLVDRSRLRGDIAGHHSVLRPAPSGKLKISHSWFEDGPEVAQAIERAPGVSRQKLAAYLLSTVFVRQRRKWADMTLRTALWLHAASPDGDLCWPDLAIVARALAEGRDMSEIGLMRDIAMRTIDVQRDGAPF